MNKLLQLFFILLSATCFLSCKTETRKAGYSGEDLSDKAAIIRDKNTKAASLQIDIDKKWQLYGGKTVESIDFSKPIAEGDKAGTYELNVPNLERYYFELTTEDGSTILAERVLPITGGYNYRDAGGFKTADGGHVKWGKLLRSDDLYNLTDDDLIYLSSVPIISVVDYRTVEDIRKTPDKMPYSVRENFVFTIVEGNMSALIAEGLEPKTADQYTETVKQIYRNLVSQPEAIEQYKISFNAMENGDYAPFMFHCSAGKDRVGVIVALALYSLGVSDEDVMEDFVLSGTCLEKKYTKLIGMRPEVAPLFEAKEEYLQAAINEIKKNHGTIDNYLVNVLDVDLQRMRELYVMK